MASHRFTTRVRNAAARWRSVVSAAGIAVLCEIGARIGLPGLDGAAVQDFLKTGHAGFLWLYNFLAGGGTSRGALLALGIVPYVVARAYLATGRALSTTIRRATDDDATRTRAIRGMTLGIAMAQAAGYLAFVSRIPNAVTQPGAVFVIRSFVLLTGGAVTVALLAERMLTRAPDDDVEVLGEPVAAMAPTTRDATARPSAV
jgi:preprotein translocase subunit SecY